MWTRRELKEKGKFAFKQNYWKAVLVAILFTLVAGGMGSAGGSVPLAASAAVFRHTAPNGVCQGCESAPA